MNATACFHCLQALPANAVRVTVDDAPRMFCCTGCAAAAEWIRAARLDDYYAMRTAEGARVGATDEDLGCWDREDVIAPHVRAVPGGRELVLIADGMRCAACAWLIDRALMREPGVLEVSANSVTARVRIGWDPTVTPLSRVLGRLRALGYRPWLAHGDERERARRAGRNRDLLRLGIAGLGAMQAMMFAEALYLDTQATMSLPMRDFLRWVACLVSTPVVFFSGWEFIAGALREVRERRLGADTLVAASTLLAYGASLVETLRGGPHVWYDAAVMFVFLLLSARLLERRARDAACARVDALARERPALATREHADGSRETVPVMALRVDDVACVAVGECVPADGVLVGDAACFEESLLTGESSPVRKRAGDAVFAGAVCREQPTRIRVVATGKATRLSQMAALVERAQRHRPHLARIADRIAAVFAVGLLCVAAVVWIAWRVHAPDRALDVVLALLVVSCPCALSLSIPAALAVANGALARMGMLPVGADALERLARVTDIVFDKTGTLSGGSPCIGDVSCFDDIERVAALRIAAALERDSRHPIAAAFAMHADDAVRATDVVAVPAQGIEGRIDGAQWRIGRADFACGRDDDGAVWLGDGRRPIARFVLRDSPRDGARSALRDLRDAGLRLHLSSGDAPCAVDRFAAALDLREARARQSPEAKLAFVRALQAEGRIVAMVGDGINDAPVLAGADVSIAIGDGAALAQRAADLVLATPTLSRIGDALSLARRTRRIIRQNLAWALAYNLLALPLAALGFVAPWLAALGMALSSLTVTLNALRLARVQRPRAEVIA